MGEENKLKLLPNNLYVQAYEYEVYEHFEYFSERQEQHLTSIQIYHHAVIRILQLKSLSKKNGVFLGVHQFRESFSYPSH